MEYALLLGYELMTVLVPAIIALAVLNAVSVKQGACREYWRNVYAIAFAVYLFGVYHFTGAGTLFDAIRYDVQLQSGQFNIIPLSNENVDFISYALNIVLFIPLGVMLSLLFLKPVSLGKVLTWGALLSILIELSQILNNRVTDIDDLITNILGALLGYALFSLLPAKIKDKYSCVKKSHSHEKEENPHRLENRAVLRYEGVVFVLATFIGRFLAFNEFGFAKLLFDF